MPLTIGEGALQLFTFREGPMGYLGHDLRLSLPAFEVTVEDARVRAWFSTERILLDGSVADGVLTSGGLSARDRATILQTAGRLLGAADHPLARYEGSASRRDAATIDVTGELELRGRARPLDLVVRRGGARLTGEVELTPSRWRIRQYRVMLGALRLQDRVVVRFDLPDPTAGE